MRTIGLRYGAGIEGRNLAAGEKPAILPQEVSEDLTGRGRVRAESSVCAATACPRRARPHM